MAKPKSYRNSGKEWTAKDIRTLKELADNTPTGLIAWELKRTKDAVYTEASKLGVSLNPINKSPDKRRKK